MSRKQLVDVDEVMALTPSRRRDDKWVVYEENMRAVIQDVITTYEVALDGANERLRDDYNSALNRVISLSAENADLRKRLDKAIGVIQVREDMCEGANEAIAMYKKRIEELETENVRGMFPYDPDGPSSEERVRRSRDGEASEPEPTPGFFNAENMDYLKSGLDVTHRRIDKLADRVAMLEKAQREGQGEL